MAISVVMPALEMAQETGKLLAWRKKEGENVIKGEPLLEIETDKAVVEIEAPANGILAGVRSHEGAVVPVGETIAWIVAPGEQPPATPATTVVGARAISAQTRTSATAAQAAKQPPSTPTVQISPKARRLAKEHGVDLSKVRGTGPDGTISTDDVLAVAQPQTASGTSDAPVPATTGALSSVARLMAERTTQSWTTVPHFFVSRDVDAGALIETRKKSVSEIEKAYGVAPSVSDFLVALAAKVLEKHPSMNSTYTGGAVRWNPDVNISLAIAVHDGVVAAVIHKANAISLGEITARRAALAERARGGRLAPSDIAGGTFTISNLGMYKVDSFTAIVTPPQAAVLAVGAIRDRVVPIDGNPGVRPMMTLTLSSDHRVVDGARAALFLNDLVEAIQEPQKWLR
jgi:pyruvate dehydrogenase E2 component (dihydrolipoamide acetyltransferase)